MSLSGAVLLLAVLPTTQTRPDSLVAFERVSVVGAESGTIGAEQTVLVRGDRIVAISPTLQLPPGTRRIDGRGRYLLPGLVDLHVHATVRDFPLFLANGVTTIREMNGSAAHLAWRDSLRRNQLHGPSLVITSPLLAGAAQRYRHVLIGSVADASAAVLRLKREGYDALKVYDGLSREVYQAIAAEAGRAGLALTGHVPAAVGLAGLAPGQRSIEHTQEILRGLDPHSPDSAALAAAVTQAGTAGRMVTPTLAVFERISLAGTPEVQALLDRPEMAYLDSSIAAWWRSFRRASPQPASERALRLAEAHRGVVRELIRQRIPILVGTDTPNPFMVPGYSLHDELDALHRAGLSREELLRAVTIGAARLLQAEREFGLIAPGLRADLVLVEGNPLEDLSLLRKPVGVMVRGQWYERSELLRSLPH